MTEHRREDDTTPLEYLITGLVILLFGLMYFFINGGRDFLSGSGQADLSVAAPALTAGVVTEGKGLGNALAADGKAVVAQAAGADKDAAESDEAKPEQEQSDADAMSAKTEPSDADTQKAGLVATDDEAKKLRDQLAAERQRADDMQRQLEDAKKSLAAEKARNAETTNEPTTEQTPQQLAQQMPTPDATASESDSNSDADAESGQEQVYKLPDGTEIPVADEGFEGAVKAAMAKPAAGENEGDAALMSEPMLFDGISFESGSAQLSTDSDQQIKALAALMNTYQDRKILIRGHTDSTGGLNANSLLSISRSDSMKKQLVALGIDKSRIKLEGVGQLEPLASNDTAEGRSQNRRIELILTQ